MSVLTQARKPARVGVCVPAHEPTDIGPIAFRDADCVRAAGDCAAGDCVPAGIALGEGCGAGAGAVDGVSGGVAGGAGTGAGAADLQLAFATGLRCPGGGTVPLFFHGNDAGVVSGVFGRICGGLPVEPEAGDVFVFRTAAVGGGAAVEPIRAGRACAVGDVLLASFCCDAAGRGRNGVFGGSQPEKIGTTGVYE